MQRMENGLYFMKSIPESFAGKSNWKMIKFIKRLRMLSDVLELGGLPLCLLIAKTFLYGVP